MPCGNNPALFYHALHLTEMTMDIIMESIIKKGDKNGKYNIKGIGFHKPQGHGKILLEGQKQS
jgi:hypothetical protein